MTPDSLSSGALGVPPEPLDVVEQAIDAAAQTLRDATAEIVRLRASLAAVSEERDKLRQTVKSISGDFIGAEEIEIRSLPGMTIAGIPISVNPLMPRGQLWLKQDGVTVATIVGVEMPPASQSALPVVEEPSE